MSCNQQWNVKHKQITQEHLLAMPFSLALCGGEESERRPVVFIDEALLNECDSWSFCDETTG